MSIAERLVKARGDMPREVVAKAVGITVSALGNYENGIRVPRDEIKVRLATGNLSPELPQLFSIG